MVMRGGGKRVRHSRIRGQRGRHSARGGLDIVGSEHLLNQEPLSQTEEVGKADCLHVIGTSVIMPR